MGYLPDKGSEIPMLEIHGENLVLEGNHVFD